MPKNAIPANWNDADESSYLADYTDSFRERFGIRLGRFGMSMKAADLILYQGKDADMWAFNWGFNTFFEFMKRGLARDIVHANRASRDLGKYDELKFKYMEWDFCVCFALNHVLICTPGQAKEVRKWLGK